MIGIAMLVGVAVLLLLSQLVVLVIGAFRTGSLAEPASFTIENFQTILSDPTFLTTAGNTLFVGIASVVIMLIWSVPFAWLYTRTDLPGKSWILVLLSVKMAVPGFLVAMGYIFLFNPSSGIANRLLMSSFGLASPPINVHSLPWIAFLQGTTLAAPAFFMMVPTFRAVDASLEEAASVSGVGRPRTVFGILLPLAAPAIVATTIYYLIVAMEMFDYAALLGMPARIFVFSTWIFQLVNPSTGEPRYDLASAIGTLFALASMALVFVYFWVTSRSERFVVVTGKRSHQNPTPLKRGLKIGAWMWIGTFEFLDLGIPILMLVWASLIPYLQPPSVEVLRAISFNSYRTALAELSPILRNTIVVMLVVPTVSVLLALCLSWVVVRTSLPGRKLIEISIVAAIGVPAIVVALAFLYFGLWTFSLIPLYTTVWIIVIAMATRYITWGTRAINSALYQLHRELEEACAAAGVRPGRAFISVVVPIIAPAILFSWFWIALLSLRELTIPVLLARRDTQVLSTAIYGFNTGGSASISAAMGVLLLIVIAILVLIVQHWVGRLAE